jgi:tetratricopeptide (TPR) repeat protein
LDSAQVDAPSARAALLIELGDWRGALVQLDAAATAQRKIEADSNGLIAAMYLLRTQVLPYEAYAHAELGEFDKADAILKTLPDDCDICARMHGRVDAARHNWNGAAHWFGLVSTRLRDEPFADTDWGKMLLMTGNVDGAIARFAVAHQRGPHFADPLEMWGEALMQENRSDLALAKFEEADKYAPNWGRLHLKWGEALGYVGRKDEARKQFAIATHLDLSAADRAALTRAGAMGR